MSNKIDLPEEISKQSIEEMALIILSVYRKKGKDELKKNLLSRKNQNLKIQKIISLFKWHKIKNKKSYSEENTKGSAKQLFDKKTMNLISFSTKVRNRERWDQTLRDPASLN